MGRIVPVPAAHRAAFGDHPVELEIPRITRQGRLLLERVAQAHHALWSGRTGKGAVVVSPTASYPRPGLIPGHDGYEGDGVCCVRCLEFVTEGLGNAQDAGPEDRPASMLGKDDGVAANAGQIDPLPSGESGVDQRAGWNLGIGGGVRENRVGVAVVRECHGGARHRLFGGMEVVRGERPAAPAHLLPDQWFRAYHPASKRIGTGAARSVVSGHAIESH